MNLEEIRKGAPVGATHYRARLCGIRVAYYILIGDIYFSMNNPIRYSLDNELIKPLP